MTDASPFGRLLDDPTLDEFEAALLVAEVLSDGVDKEKARTEVAALAQNFGTSEARSGESLCEFMAHQGFVGAVDDYYGLATSCVDQVLERRTGIPITLAVVYLKVARILGMQGSGINYPGRFLVDIAGQLIDPYRGALTDRPSCERLLQEAGYTGSLADAFRVTTARDIALRMLNNARGIFNAAGRWADALELLDHQQLLAPDEVELCFERARLWAAAGSVDMAREVLEAARKRFSNPHTQRAIDERLAEFPTSDSDPVLN
jgi:regulator of sirC expression with transglutaminase-like and TPR domain